MATTPPPLDYLDPNASRFPAEVYEHIVDFLASRALLIGSPYILALCCLTSRLWFPRSRFHLYFELVLDSRERFEKLVHCLEINPANSAYVRKLVISPSGDQGWVSAVPLTLIPKLKNLSTLRLTHVKLTSLHPSFPQHLTILSTVPKLELFGVFFHGMLVVQMILAFPRLQKLLISGSTFAQFHDEATALATARRKGPFPLRHLSLRGNFAPILLPAIVASATPLTTLDLSLSPGGPSRDIEQGLQSLGLLLSSCDTLRALRLTTDELCGYAAVCSRISFSLSKLRHLRLCTNVQKVEGIAVFAGLVSTISARTLQFLELELDVVWNPQFLDTLASWKMLNESLLRPNVRSAREIATSILVKRGTYASKEEVFRLLPALKSVNVVDRWSDQRFEEFWNQL